MVFSDTIVVAAVSPGGPADGKLAVGDRVCNVNEEWSKRLKQTRSVIQDTLDSDFGELDITVARLEPLPARPGDLDAMDLDDLELFVFQHTGQRLFCVPDKEDEFKAEAFEALAGRFQD